MTVFAIDTSSAASSAALLLDDGSVVERQHVDGRRHAEVLAPLVADLLAQAPHVSLIAVGVGPGPYTGLRVGLASARALGMALSVRVVGVCSLDALAAEHGDGDRIVASDARRSERYWARYRGAGSQVTRTAGPHVGAPGSWPPGLRVVDGPYPSAASIARLALAWSADEVSSIDPSALAAHGDDDGSTAAMLAGATLLEPRPLYVRRADAAEPGAGS